MKRFLAGCLFSGLVLTGTLLFTPSNKYSMTCTTPYGILRVTLDGSRIGGLYNSMATTYTIKLENGAETTISKNQCLLIKAVKVKVDEEFSQ